MSKEEEMLFESVIEKSVVILLLDAIKLVTHATTARYLLSTLQMTIENIQFQKTDKPRKEKKKVNKVSEILVLIEKEKHRRIAKQESMQKRGTTELNFDIAFENYDIKYHDM